MNYNLKYDAKPLEYPMFKSINPNLNSVSVLPRGNWGIDKNGKIVLIDDNGYAVMILEEIKGE